MTRIVKRYLADATTRQIWDDSIGTRERYAGVIPRRASRIEVIEEGVQLGKFHVDFSLLSLVTKNDEHKVCLVQTFDSYKDANAAEVEWLKNNWVLDGINNVQSDNACLATCPS